MFRKADYSFKWDDKGRPVVVIDLHDGFLEECTETSLVKVLELIRRKRRKYKSEAEWRNLITLFQGALDYLHQHLARTGG